MEQEQTYHFKTETIYDVAVHNEFQNGFKHASLIRTILGIFLTATFASYIFLFQLDIQLVYVYLILGALVFVIRAPQLIAGKKGNLQYKRMVHANGGKTVHQIITFEETDIRTVNRDNKNENHYGYDQILSLIETKNLLLLTMKYRLCLVVEKRWLKGGTVEELKAFLQNRCPNVKKKVRGDKFGRIVNIVLIVVLVIGAIFAVQKLFASGAKGTGQLSRDITGAEIMEQLEPLGITCSDETFLQIIDEYEYESGECKILDMLCWLGFGEYDSETWEWTPSTNGVYWFDAEFLVVNTMYTDFLRGISALDEYDLAFTNIQEDYSNVNWEQSIGTVSISFDWNGRTYKMNASMMNDWFDISVLETVCDIISEKSEKSLYYAYDGGQGYLVFYGDAQWATEFTRLTGISLDSN